MHTSKEVLLSFESTNQDCFFMLAGLSIADLNIVYFTVPNGEIPLAE